MCVVLACGLYMALDINLKLSNETYCSCAHKIHKTAEFQSYYKLFSKWNCKFKFGLLPLFSFVSCFIDEYHKALVNSVLL